MNNIVLKFLNSNNEFNLDEFSFTNKTPLTIDDLNKNVSYTKKRNSLQKLYEYFFSLPKSPKEKDENSIKKLESNIIETFKFLKNENLIPRLFPQKINFRFLRDTYLEQNQHKEEQLKTKNNVDEKYEQYADARLKDKNLNNEAVINISTEHVKSFVTLSDKLNGKFLKVLKNNFSNKILFNIPTNNSNKIITELVILHELGHLISSEKIRETLISRSFRNIKDDIEFPIVKKIIKNEDGEKEILINHVNNISRNILEGFSDCFAVYITQQHYLKHDIISRYAQARKETSVTSDNTIKSYDLNNIFNSIRKIKSKDINLLIDEFFDIAINNTINITKRIIKK